MKKKLLLTLTMLMFISVICFGQSGAGGLKGTLKSSDGTVLPGIFVTLTSPAIVVKQLTTVTNENGVYRFNGLMPGLYQVKFELEGMQTVIRKGITVNVGKTFAVDQIMNLTTIQESIVVIGKPPTIDRQKTTGVASMDLEFLKAIPVANRDFTGYFNLTPGVTGDTSHGSGEMDNAYLLDGVNMGDPSTGTSYVGFGNDIMAEIAVQSGGISAEYGSVKGAVVNIVTKSGGNKFSGTAAFYYNHESLQSDNTEGTDLYDPENTTKVGQKFKMEPVLTLGGPVIKDKLWFFMNLSMTNEETYAPGYPHDEDTEVAADQKRYFPYLKLTFQPTQSDKFTVSYNYSNRIRNHRGAAWWENVEHTVTQESPTHVFNAHWTKNFGDNLYANLKVAMIDSFMGLHAKKPGTDYSDYTTSLSTGSAWRNEDNNIRNRYQVNLDATTFIDDLAGSHELKFGGELQIAKTNWEVKTYDSPGAPVDVMDWGYIGVTGSWYNFGYNFNGGFDRKDDMQNFSFFVNDTWSITNNITLNIGLRYDNQSLIWPAQALDKTSVWSPSGTPYDMSMSEKTTPMKWNNFTPRLGLIYDIFSDGTTLFKASWSTYVQPNQTGWINTAHPNGWYGWYMYIDAETENPMPQYGGPWVFWAPGATTGIGYENFDLTAPVSDELTIGIERELFEDWSFGIRYIKKWDKNNIHKVDSSQIDIAALMNDGELNWIDYEMVTVTDPYNNEQISFYNDLNPGRTPEEFIVNPPGADRFYDGIEITLNKRYSHGFALNASYVYANSRGMIDTNRGSQALGTSGLFADPNAHINNDGRFFLERRHQVKITGLVKGPWGLNVSGYFRYLAGNRRTRTVTDEYIDLDLNQSGRVTNFAEQKGNTAYPDIFMLDLRLEKAFKIKNVQLAVFADLFNVFNSNTTTAYRTADVSHPTLNWMETTSISAPRVIRVGAKIEFN